MKLFPKPEATILGIARALRSGERSCRDVVESCLERIESDEAELHAWVMVDAAGARRRARELDGELRRGRDLGPLHGIPVGVKDIIAIRGWPTGLGSPRPSTEPAATDAVVVQRLRAAGAVILGKTVTTAFACLDPPPTRNPWNLDRTPGGSSSGSAAAVARGMCLAALGTQTGGSITRPAAFCGAAGMKPSHGLVPTQGVFPLAPSFDHVGALAATVGDLATVLGVLARGERGNPISRPIRLVTPGGIFDSRAEEAMRTSLGGFLDRARTHGAIVSSPERPTNFEELIEDHRIAMFSEVSAVHLKRMEAMPEAYPPRIKGIIVEGASLPAKGVRQALENRAAWIAQALELFGDDDALITPAAPGPAPDRATTGDAVFNSPWSYLGFPTVSVPIELSAGGLPLAVQLIGRPGTDFDLLEVARWCEQVARR